jgi:uncharacterized repeat protein (TIGR03803 family)
VYLTDKIIVMKNRLGLAATLALLLSSCSLEKHSAGTTLVQIHLPQGTESSTEQASEITPFAFPSNLSSFNCYAINVTASDIPPLSGCTTTVAVPGQYLGLTAGAFASSVGSIALEVPNGVNRTIQLLGYDVAGGACSTIATNLAANGTGYLLATTNIDVLNDVTVSMTPTFSTAGSQIEFGTTCSGSSVALGETVLHSFTSATSDGSSPRYGNLTLSGSKLYGMTAQGGSSSQGTIFSIGTDGTGFTILHNFTATTADGGGPQGSLLLSGSKFYGMTYAGGASGDGTIFSIGTDGTGFTILYSFTGSSDGGLPSGNLILSGSTLYGMASADGVNSDGVIFSIGTNGSGFTVLYSFTGAPDGKVPTGDLVLSGSTLYGMTSIGGTSSDGVIFSVATNGTGYTVLHAFTGTPDGSTPLGSLTLSGTTLYGMASQGGTNGQGSLFSISTSGTGFTLLHSFQEVTTNGGLPSGSLALSGSMLYGTTTAGGSGSLNGTLFGIGIDGTGFSVLHSFSSGAADGSDPNGTPLVSGNTLYGMTSTGGSISPNTGILFSYGF